MSDKPEFHDESPEPDELCLEEDNRHRVRRKILQARRRVIRQEVVAASTPTTSVPTAPTEVDLVNPDNVSSAEQSESSNLDNLGTNSEIQPLTGIDTISIASQNLKDCHEGCYESSPELGLEVNTADEQNSPQLRPAAVSIDQPVLCSGESNERVSVSATQYPQPSQSDSGTSLASVLSEFSRSFRRDTSCDTANRGTTVVPENCDNAAENSQTDQAAADSQQIAAAESPPLELMPTFPPEVGSDNSNDVSSAQSSQSSSMDNLGTFTPFRHVIGRYTSLNNDQPLDVIVRHQAITVMPEYCNKSMEELRLEDYLAKRHHDRQGAVAESSPLTLVPTIPPEVSRDNSNNVSTDQRSQSRGSFTPFRPVIGFDTIMRSGQPLHIVVRHQAISVMPEYCNKSSEELRLEDYRAQRQYGRQASQSDKFEDYALKIPLKPLPLAITLPSSSTLRLSDDKLAVTRRQGIDANTRNICSKDRINDYVTICPQFNTDQFIVIQILKVHDNEGMLYLYTQVFSQNSCAGLLCKRNDVFIIWLNEEGKVIVTKTPARNDGCTTVNPISVSDGAIKSGQCPLLADMLYHIEEIRAFIGNRKDAEPFLRKQSPSITSTIPSQAIQTGFSLSLLCEVQDNQILPVDFEYSRNTSTYNLRRPAPVMFRPPRFLIEESHEGVSAAQNPQFPQFDSGSNQSTAVGRSVDSRSNTNLAKDVLHRKSTASADSPEKSGRIGKPESSDDEKLCKICMENAANVVLLPCGHVCLCYECSIEMKYRNHKNCPICRSDVQSTHKVYFS